MSHESDKSREFIESQQDDQAPLTKPRKSKTKVTTVEPTIEPPIEPEIKPVKAKKPRAPKTQKQLEVFKEKCALARQNNIKKKKDDIIESAKQIVKKEIKKTKQNIVVESETSSSDSDPEVIHVRRKSNKSKKSKKKIVVVHSESDSSDSEPKYERKPEFGKSHRNKKSVPVVQPPMIKPVDSNIKNPINFFAD
jgi:hypothetical protein